MEDLGVVESAAISRRRRVGEEEFQLLHSISAVRGQIVDSTHGRIQYPHSAVDSTTCCRFRWEALRLKGGGGCLSVLEWYHTENQLNAALIRAAAKGRTEEVKRLVRLGADIHASNEAKQSALIRAAENGQTETVIQLLKLGAEIMFMDRRNSTALHYAAYNGHSETVAALVARGSEVNVANKFGYSALQYAAADGQDQTVKQLMLLGADVNRKDKMCWTALHRAAAGGYTRTVRNLLKYGACVHGGSPNSTDYTPLHEAVWCGQLSVSRVLVEHGADPLRPDEWGTTPLALAQSQVKDGNRELWDFLCSVTGEVNDIPMPDVARTGVSF